MSIDKEVSSVSEGYDQLVKTIIAPYHKHLYTYGDKLKTSLLRYMNSLVTVCVVEREISMLKYKQMKYRTSDRRGRIKKVKKC